MPPNSDLAQDIWEIYTHERRRPHKQRFRVSQLAESMWGNFAESVLRSDLEDVLFVVDDTPQLP